MRIFHTCVMAAAIAAASLSSCRHKEVCDDHSHTARLDVVFDWSDAPGATPGIMSLYLFPADGSRSLRYDFTDIAGGTVSIPAGEYSALCLNSDTERILYRNTGLAESFEVYTGETGILATLSSTGIYPSASSRAGDDDTPPRADGAGSEPSVAEPDMLWTDTQYGLRVSVSEEPQRLTMRPAAALRSYTVEITGADNLHHVTAISATLSGMGRALLIDGREPSPEASTVPFGVSVSDDLAGIGGSLKTFGPAAIDGISHKLVVYAVMDNGEKWYYTYDVTSQITGAPDPWNVVIRLEGLPLPAPMAGGDGFVPEVDGWQDIHHDILMKPSV